MRTALNPAWVAYEQGLGATYRLFPSTSGPASGTVDTAQYVMGISFKVTSPGLALKGWWHWVAASGQSVTAEDFALWQATGIGAGTYITGSVVTSGAFTAGQWNFVSCASPIALTSGTEYRAVKSVNKAGAGIANGYSSTSLYWGNAGAGGNGIINGPLLAYSSPVAPVGNSNLEPAGDGQMVFSSGNVNATTAYPATQFNATNYWLDVQVG